MNGIHLDPLQRALDALTAGHPVIVVDDESRENEGDLIFPAAAATQQLLAFTVRHSSGIICVALPGDRLEELELPQMVTRNADPKGTAFTVSVDAAVGVSTGISAADRALTLRLLAGADTGPGDLTRPGHIFPLRARPGGVLERRGHTEAGVDLMALAGQPRAGALVELVHDDGTMMRAPALRTFADRHDLAMISIEQIAAHRRTTRGQPRHGNTEPASASEPSGTAESSAQAEQAGPAAPSAASEPSGLPDPAAPSEPSEPTASSEPAEASGTSLQADPLEITEAVDLPTVHGSFRALAVRERPGTLLPSAGQMMPAGGAEHLVLTQGDLSTGEPVLTRVHSECITGDVLGSRRCDCGPQLQEALARIEQEERGVLILLRGHEGRGIGLVEKLRAYALQESGRDTIDANLELGLPVDARSFLVAAQILEALGVQTVRLLSHNPVKTEALQLGGIEVAATIDLATHPTPENLSYLTAKRDRLGHHLLGLPGQSAPARVRRAQPAPGKLAPGQPAPGQPAPGQSVPGQSVPGQPAPGHSAETHDAAAHDPHPLTAPTIGETA